MTLNTPYSSLRPLHTLRLLPSSLCDTPMTFVTFASLFCALLHSSTKERKLTSFLSIASALFAKTPGVAPGDPFPGPTSSPRILHKFFRMNTYKTVSKQRTLTGFRINTYTKQGGGRPSLTSFCRVRLLRRTTQNLAVQPHLPMIYFRCIDSLSPGAAHACPIENAI